jgi:ABC-type Na+ transport system ATPase subunit NatA
VRGIPEPKLQGLIAGLISKLGLGPFAEKISEGYSGGTKRKLSLALALIGDPSVVFLSVTELVACGVNHRLGLLGTMLKAFVACFSLQ